jgi:hypothetical protein
MALSLDHVQIAAPSGCEELARVFFGELLGLCELPKPVALRERGGVWFSLGTQQLHVGVEDPFAPARKAHPALRIGGDEIDLLAERLEQAGHAVAWHDDLPEVTRFFTADPWGNRLEILAAA